MSLATDVLTLDEAATELKGKLSRASLYRIANDGLDDGKDSPFHKVRGKWLTTRDELVAWIKRQPGGGFSGDPMPGTLPRKRSVDELMDRVQEIKRRAA